MILNIINRKLSDFEITVLNDLRSISDIVNVDFSKKNNELNVKLNDVINQQSEILSYANMADSIVVWGRFAPHQLSWKFLRSIISREYTYFAGINRSDIEYYKKLKKDISPLIAQQINKFLVSKKENENEYFVEEVNICRNNGENFLGFGIREILGNLKLLSSMATSIFKQETINTTLGIGWHFIRDLIFFTTYALFMLFIRGNRPIDNLPVVAYLMTGLVSWYFMFDVMNGGVACIKQSAYIIKKINFPINIIPMYSTLSILYRRIVTYLIVMVVIGIYIYKGQINKFDSFLLLYYTFSMILFAAAFNLVVCGIVAVSKDFFQLYKAFTRILIYLNPVFWNISFIQKNLSNLSFVGSRFVELIFEFYLKINPVAYILTGYREVFGGESYNTLSTSIVFWFEILTLFVLGFYLQSKLRKVYADIL